MPEQQPPPPNMLLVALQTLFGLSNRQVGTLQGEQNARDKLVKLDSLENNLTQTFLGNADISMDRSAKYRDYDRMDVQSTECQTALNIYAEEAAQKDQKTGMCAWVESANPQIAAELNAMFVRLKLEAKIYGVYRNIAKYGDCFMYLILGAFGVHGMQFVHPRRIERVQEDGLVGFKSAELAAVIPMDNRNMLFPPWQLVHWRLMAFDQESLYGKCYDDKTEVLTRRGWLKFKNVTKKDEIATRNMDTKNFEWQLPTDITAQQYEGEMISLKSRSVDLLVTPNHRVLIRNVPKELTNNKRRHATTSNGEVVVLAEELLKTKTKCHIPQVSNWQGVEIKEKIFADTEEKRQVLCARKNPSFSLVGNGGSNLGSWQGEYIYNVPKLKSFSLSGNDFCALMGAYLSEGNLKTTGGIEINQQEYSKGFLPYKELFSRIVPNCKSYNGNAFILSKKVITSYFEQFGKAKDKFIPEEIMNATKEQLRIFWDHFVLGDGCYPKRVNNSGRGNVEKRTTITTVSKKLAEQLVEIAQKLGWSASVSENSPKFNIIKQGESARIINGNYNRFDIRVRYSKTMAVTAKKEFYSGTIYCVTVPNGIIYVRRNGKPSWCGNSFVESIRKTWKSLQMLETLLILYRLNKTVQRNIFYVDVGQAAVQETENMVKSYDKFLKNKTQFIDTKTNDFKIDFNPATMLQDIIWPVRSNSVSRVEQLQNNPNIGSLEDLEHLKQKIRIGLNIPREYFDGETQTGMWNSKEALIVQDIRFGRKINMLQNAMQEGLTQLCQIHWAIAHQEFLPIEGFTVRLGTANDFTERVREDVLLRKAQVLEILANISIVLGWNRRAWADYLLDEVFPLPVALRKKLFTPDEVQIDQLKAEAKISKSVGEVVKHKEVKPQKKVTADNLRMGLRNFGESEDPLKIPLLEEFQEGLRELKSLEEAEKELFEKNNYAVYGFAPEELQSLIASAETVKSKLTQNLLEETEWKTKTDWKTLHNLGMPRDNKF